MAPGKDIAAASGDDTPDTERRAKWQEWQAARIAQFRATLARYHAALGLVPCAAQASGDCDTLVPAGFGPSYTGFCGPCDERRVDEAACGPRRDDE